MSGADRHRPALALAPALHVAVGKRRWVGPAPLCALLFALLSVVAVGADPATAGATVASSPVASAAGVPAPGFRFTDVSADAGLTGLVYSSESAHSLGVNWVDIDNDGWVDLFAVGGAPEHPPRLFRNLGDGTFEPARHCCQGSRPPICRDRSLPTTTTTATSTSTSTPTTPSG